MRQQTISTLAHSAFLLALALTTACGGGGVQGLYSGGDDAFFQSLEFKSDGKVEITFMGMAREGTYVIEDDRVKVTASGDTQIFKIRDDGCLAGGGLVGTYCKGGDGSYTVTSDQVVITADGESMTFARQGDALVGDFDGMAVRFMRK